MIKNAFKNPYLVMVFAIVVALLSWVLIPRMAVDILPQFDKSAMQILTLYPGMPAEVVEKDITSRMERWTGQSPGIEKQLSKSIMGVSIVTNYYGEDVDPAEAMANTSAYAMSDMYYQPPGTLPPMVQPFDPTASKPLMLLTVSSEVKSGKELYDLAYYNLRQMLSGVRGIVAPAAYGGSKRRIHIYVDPAKLESFSISQTEVNDAIQKNTTMIPSGVAEIGEINYGIDAKGMITHIADFNDIVVTYRNGNPIYIKDLARAEDASVIQTNIARVDGKSQVYLPIFKRPGANTIASVEAVKAAIPGLKERMPNDVNLDVIFDQSSYVRNSISGLTNAALGGLILVVIVLILFLGSFRSALIVSISLPLSVLFTFIVLYFTNQAINSITLGGIALVLGLLVDNSIVVLENIDRHLLMGKPKLIAAKDAAIEVATPVLASTLVIIVVFFPVLFLTGMAKFLFSPLAITVAGAMVGSYIFSLTLVPLMAGYFLKDILPLRVQSDTQIPQGAESSKTHVQAQSKTQTPQGAENSKTHVQVQSDTQIPQGAENSKTHVQAQSKTQTPQGTENSKTHVQVQSDTQIPQGAENSKTHVQVQSDTQIPQGAENSKTHVQAQSKTQTPQGTENSTDGGLRPKRSEGDSKAGLLGIFKRLIDKLRGHYTGSLIKILKYRWLVLVSTLGLFIISLLMFANLGYELFPQSDVGQMEIQVRLESGTPLKTTEANVAKMEALIKADLGEDLEQLISNIGILYDLPAAYTPNSGTQDAFIGIQLKEDHAVSTFEYARRLRKILTNQFPGVELSFNTGGLITAALNDGKPAPIDVQVKGNNLEVMRAISERLRDTISQISTTRDVRILQRIDQPTKDIDIDRIKAAELGVEPVDAIKNMVSALNSSATFDKSFWIDERNGNHYFVGVTYPEHLINDKHILDNVTVTSKTHDKPVPFRNFSKITESTNPVEVNHHNLGREFNVYANVDGADIGAVSDEIEKRIKAMTFPTGYKVQLQGEIAMMKSSFQDLGFGLILAVLLAFLIITPLFRSFKQPLIIIVTFPLGIIGVVLLMWITNTNLNIQSLMGMIMMVGIAVSYGNILVDRINGLISEGFEKREAVVKGASDRFRPVLMTASTTIFGLLPTALSTSAGTESNVPLAIAVIGGTFMATLLTLYIIPILYSFGSAKKTSKA